MHPSRPLLLAILIASLSPTAGSTSSGQLPVDAWVGTDLLDTGWRALVTDEQRGQLEGYLELAAKQEPDERGCHLVLGPIEAYHEQLTLTEAVARAPFSIFGHISQVEQGLYDGQPVSLLRVTSEEVVKGEVPPRDFLVAYPAGAVTLDGLTLCQWQQLVPGTGDEVLLTLHLEELEVLSDYGALTSRNSNFFFKPRSRVEVVGPSSVATPANWQTLKAEARNAAALSPLDGEPER